MKTQSKFWWFVSVALFVTLGVLVTIASLFWQQLSDLEQQYIFRVFKQDFAYFFMVAVLLFAAFGFTLDWFFRFYIVPVNQLAEETQIITTVNPHHRIDPQGSYDVVRLSEIINQSADRWTALKADVEHRILKSKTEAETEKNILAALLEWLPQGIIVCNTDGHIVFYNHKVKTFFSRRDSKSSNWIGLGRSIYGFVDRILIKRAIGRIEQKLSSTHEMVGERFFVKRNGEITIPAELVPVLDRHHQMSGFIIYIEDTVEKFQKEQAFFSNFEAWQHKLIQSVAVIKTSAEMIKDQSYESEQDRQQLVRVLCHESNMAAQTLSKNEIMDNWYPDRPWPLTPIDAAQWCRYLVHLSREIAEVHLDVQIQDRQSKISIDMYHLTNALLFVFRQIIQECGQQKIVGHFFQQGAWVYLDIGWPGDFKTIAHLKRWKKMIPVVDKLKLDICLGEILRLHGAKLWTRQNLVKKKYSGLRFLIPVIERAEVVRIRGHVTIIPDSRPEFYDFDLFQQAGQTPEIDNRRLNELTYTVFDTETTGLDPHGGDEIISIGALRIVNGRLLYHERFEQLINPKRNIPWASVKYHGIRTEMLIDQPTIDQVLPEFYEFTQNTVLIGHNVAFDMRMLQLKETSTGVRFIHPVIDTMLLSAVVHPAHNDHSLDAICQRLGVEIVNRHTAIGDATAAGEVFLKLLFLLSCNGIDTLLKARQACQKNSYSRLRY